MLGAFVEVIDHAGVCFVILRGVETRYIPAICSIGLSGLSLMRYCVELPQERYTCAGNEPPPTSSKTMPMSQESAQQHVDH